MRSTADKVEVPADGWRRRAAGRGFTRTDLLVLVAVGTVLGALIMVPLTRLRGRTRMVLCLGNLQQVARSVILYAEDHGQTLPAPVRRTEGDYWWWYKEQVKGYIGLSGPSSISDRVFACPSDRGYSDPGPFWSNARFDFGSYVFNGVMLLGTPHVAGWRLPAIQQPQRTLLVMEWTAHAPLSWHRSRTGRVNAPFYRDAESVVAFADGHAKSTRIYYDGFNAAYTRDPIPGYDYKYSGR